MNGSKNDDERWAMEAEIGEEIPEDAVFIPSPGPWATAEALREALYEFNGHLTFFEYSGLEEAVDVYRFLTAVYEYVRDMRAEAGEQAAQLMRGREESVAEVGTVKRTGGKNRSGWEHDDLFARVLAASRDEIRYDPDTGERLEGDAEAFLRVLRDCMGTPGYWKLGDKVKGTGLAARGIDADEYCKTEQQRPGISVPTAAKIDLAVAGSDVHSALRGKDAGDG